MWTPRPDEADRFCDVYIDETSQNAHRFLAIGGLVVPLSHTEQFEADIIASRDDVLSIADRDGKPRVIKWQKVGAYNLDSYKKVVNAFFAFPMKRNLPTWKHVDINCVVVDTQEKDLCESGGGDVEIGFNKEVYFLCVPMIGQRFRKELFRIYADRRTTRHPIGEARNIMNNGAKKHGDRRLYPYRHLSFADPEQCQALQVVDIFIGALAYRLNHYDKPNANPAKKELCDYILRRSKIDDPFKTVPFNRRRFAVMHRRAPVAELTARNQSSQ